MHNPQLAQHITSEITRAKTEPELMAVLTFMSKNRKQLNIHKRNQLRYQLSGKLERIQKQGNMYEKMFEALHEVDNVKGIIASRTTIEAVQNDS